MSAESPGSIEYGWLSVFGGLFVAPPAAGLAVGVLLTFTGLFPALLIAPIYATILGWPAAYVFGIPLYLVLRRRRVTWWGAYVAGAMLLGLAAGVAAGMASEIACDGRASCGFFATLPQGAFGATFGALIGAISGLVFWRVVRPDDLQTYAAVIAARRVWLKAGVRLMGSDTNDGGTR
jgi:hypothetical protein